MNVKIGTTWHPIKEIHVKVGTTWHKATELHSKIGTTWQASVLGGEEPVTLKWELTTGTSYNGSYNAGFGSNTEVCQTDAQLLTKLTSNRPPNNYTLGYRMRVQSSYEVCDPFFGCNTQDCAHKYFITVEA